MSDHLRPTAAIAPTVLAPSDPGLALALAQRLLVKPLMANHHHGLWGYSGATASGMELTIQSTGIGGASTAAVLFELARLGVRRAVRVGRCTGLAAQLDPGDALVATRVLGDDAISRRLGAGAPDARLTAELERSGAGAAATVAGGDLVSELGDPEHHRHWLAAGAAVADLETGAALAFASAHSLRLAAGLVVGVAADGSRDEAGVDAALGQLGEACAAALEAAGESAAQAPAPGAVKLP